MAERPRLLIVDDEPSIAKVVRKQLEVAGFEVAVAKDGVEALASVQAHHPDLILLDVMLPKINGHEVCKALRADPQTRAIPIIMLSANARLQDEQHGLEQGASAYLTKPFQLDVLLRHIHQLLGPRQSMADSSRPPV